MLRKLSNAFGPSGYEDEVRNIIKSEMKNLCDEMYEDSIGNLICHKKGVLVDGKSIMLTAHIDEVGFIISGITEKGFLEFKTVGGIDTAALLFRNVKI